MDLNGMEIKELGILPDGSSDIFGNCMEGFDEYSVFLRLCGGTTPTPTASPTPKPTPSTLSPTAHWHGVFECTEGDVNIGSPTFSSINTSNVLDEAVIECQGACQASDDCKYWSLNRDQHMCELKQNNTGKVPSESYISGERLCDHCGNNKTEDLFCGTKGCEVSLSVTGICSKEFTIEV
jgi:hypothetical protein